MASVVGPWVTRAQLQTNAHQTLALRLLVLLVCVATEPVRGTKLAKQAHARKRRCLRHDAYPMGAAISFQ